MGVIKDEELFDFIDNNINKILNIDLEITEKIIIKSVENKIEIVVKDEKEEGLRQILNYGHTIGHAIEILKEGLLSHGHCVAIGMKLASDIAVNQGIMNLDDQSRQNELLEKLNINLDLPNDLQIDEIIEKILLDKKNTANNVNFVLIKKIGQIHLNNGKHTSLITKEHIIKVLKNKL
jgi:3-dehydroquinate synthase